MCVSPKSPVVDWVLILPKKGVAMKVLIGSLALASFVGCGALAERMESSRQAVSSEVQSLGLGIVAYEIIEKDGYRSFELVAADGSVKGTLVAEKIGMQRKF